MKFLFSLLLLFANQKSFAVDCDNVAAFIPIGKQNATISAAHFFWRNGQQRFEEICTEEKSIPVYDVRGREEEAYYCLKSLKSQIATCSTMYNSKQATATIVPASWIQSLESVAMRSYRFHTYIQPIDNQEEYLDIFARTLTFQLENQLVILEGSKTVDQNSQVNDGFWIRIKFHD